MIKYKIEKTINLESQITVDRIVSQLEQTGYHIVRKTEISITFDNDNNSSKLVSKGYFFDKVDKGVVELIKKGEETVITLNYFVSFESVFIPIFMLSIGAICVTYKIIFLLPVFIVVFLYQLYVIKKAMLGVLEKF